MNDHAPLLDRVFAPECRDFSENTGGVEDEVPSFVRGVCYFNGPRRFERGGLRYNHWLDGDGMVTGVYFEDGGTRVVSRFIHSVKFTNEERAGAPLYRTFGTRFAGDRLRRGVSLESPVNVSVLPFGTRLLAFGEQGLPWLLDAASLETLGQYSFHGALNDISPFAAHAKVDPGTGELINFGVAFSNPAWLVLYRFDSGGRLLLRKRIAIEYPCSIHDFAITPHYAIVHMSPYVLNVAALLQEGRTLMESLEWRCDRPSRFLILDRATGEMAGSVEAGQSYCLHWIGASENGHELTLDLIEFERPIYDQYCPVPDLFHSVPGGSPVRYRVDVRARTVLEREAIRFSYAPDFPATARDYRRRFWTLGIAGAGLNGRKFFNLLARMDWRDGAVETWRAPGGTYFASEPVYIDDPGDPGRGAILCQMFETFSDRAVFALFDAVNIARGPVARIPVASPLPPAFHGTFVAA